MHVLDAFKERDSGQEFCARHTGSAGLCFYAFWCLNILAYGHCKPHRQLVVLNDEKSQSGSFVCAGATLSTVLKETEQRLIDRQILSVQFLSVLASVVVCGCFRPNFICYKQTGK